jgi:pre-rRNA-processing protein TSR2
MQQSQIQPPPAATLSQAIHEFRAGVTAVMRSWSALKTSVTSEWGGVESKAKATELRTHIIQAFEAAHTNNSKIMDQYDLEDNLLMFMDEEFSIVLEDDSEKQVALTICTMFEQCYAKGDFLLCRQMVAMAEHIRHQESGKPQQPVQVMEQEDMDDDDDDTVNGDSMMESTTASPADTTAACAEAAPQTSSALSPDAASFITGTLNATTHLPPVAQDIVIEYANMEIPLFGAAKKAVPEGPPPRQLGQSAPDATNNIMDEMDDDGFVTIKTKGKR